MDRVTVIKSQTPVNKRYLSDGSKIANAKVNVALALSYPCGTSSEMVSVLSKITDSDKYCVIPGVWKNDPGVPFNIWSDGKFVSEFGGSCKCVLEHDGSYYASRKKRAIESSSWVLLDADDNPGCPDEWVGMSLSDRLDMFELILPGISTCERIELRASSERVVGYGTGRKSHAWIRISDPSKLETLRAHVLVESNLKGLSYPSPIRSRDTGEVRGHTMRTLFDMSVFIPGRIVFSSKPVSELGEVLDADIEVCNEGCGSLNVDWVEVPTPLKVKQMNSKMNTSLRITSSGSVMKIYDNDSLSLHSIIIDGDRERLLVDIVDEMEDNCLDSYRVQAPFRESYSNAGVVFLSERGVTCWDHGTNELFIVPAEEIWAWRYERLHRIVEKEGVHGKSPVESTVK